MNAAIRKIGRLLADLAVPVIAVGLGLAIVYFGIALVLTGFDFLSEQTVSAIRRTSILVVTVAAYWVSVRCYQRRTVPELTVRPGAILASSLSGVALISLPIAAGLLLGFYQIHAYRGFEAAMPIIGYLLVAASIEEILFRGILFGVVEKHSNTVFALVVQSLLFGSLHLLNDAATATSAVSVTLLGAFWALVYVHSRNLWVVIANHLFWNLTIFCAGLPLSGVARWRAAAPLETSYGGPVWLSGGRFGPEDSALSIGIVAAALVGLGVWCHRTGRLRLRTAS